MVSRLTWYQTSHGYVARTNDARIYLHRFVNKTPDGYSTDHINGIRLDCRRENLRTATDRQNARNKSKQAGTTSSYKGVFRVPGKGKNTEKNLRWLAYIGAAEERDYLGYFKTELDAELAYNRAAVLKFGEFAKLNDLPLDFQSKAEPERWVREKLSPYFGVSRHVQGLWFSTKTIGEVHHHFGYHKTDKEAAIAYNQGVKELLGDKAKLNVIL